MRNLEPGNVAIRGSALHRKTLVLAVNTALALAASNGALAATYFVSNLNDGTNSAGTLRQAIANANGNAASTVQFQSGLAGTITLSVGEIPVTGPITIVGLGADKITVSAGGASRVFNVTTPTGTAVTISGLTLTGGYTSGRGGAIYTQDGTLNLNDCVISNNVADTSGAGLAAEGMDNVALKNDTFLNNEAPYGAAFLLQTTQSTITGVTVQGNTGTTGVGGGLIAGSSTITNSQFVGNNRGALQLGGGSHYITGSTFSQNNGTTGAAILAQKVTMLTLANSSLIGNYSTGVGGALAIASGGTASIQHSLISGNRATGQGGGIESSNLATLGVSYSTISHNSASAGGGISVVGGGTNTTISDSTIADNVSSGTGGGLTIGSTKGGTAGNLTLESDTIAGNYAYDAGGVHFLGTSVVHNSIIARNTISASGEDPDVEGNTITFNSSLVGDAGNVTINGSGNLVGVDPLLGALGDYGGGLPTMRPRSGSPVIDAGDPAGSILTMDERGQARVAGAAIDMGAVEVQLVEDTIFLDGFERD